MAKKAMARVVSALGFLLGLAGLLVLTPSLAISGTFVSGLDYPTGLAIHPNERSLYVKSGITGRVWKIPIGANGTAGGSPIVMTDNFSLYNDIDFDASGNLYGAVVNDDTMVRLTPGGGIETADLYETPGGGGIAIEPPGLPTNKLYFVDDDFDLYFFPIASFLERYPDAYDGEDLGETCGQFRFLHHRLSLSELLGTYADKLVSVNPSSGSCTTLLSGLIQPNGIAEDLDGNIYVADTLAGTVIKLTVLGQVEVFAEGLASPTGLVFDSETDLLFVSETDADQIITIGGPPPPPDCTDNQTPLAIAQAEPTSGSAPLTVQFDGDDSLDADGSIVEYLWTFGDGEVSTEPNPVHTYTSPGIYTATLVVTDNCGAISSDEVSIFICPVATALEEDSNKEAKLELLRQFRDEVLGASSEGEHYVQLFYTHAVELSWLLLRYPELRSQSRVLIDRFLPVVQSVLAGEQAEVRQAELEDVEALLGAFAVYGSAELRANIQAVQAELRKEGVLEQFGIVVR